MFKLILVTPSFSYISEVSEPISSNQLYSNFIMVTIRGGTQIWFRQGCAAEAAKPLPIFKGHFGGKGYPLLGVFIQENDVFVYFSDKMGENI